MTPSQPVPDHGLETELARLEQALADDRAAGRNASRAMLLVSSLLGLVVLGFVLVNYLHFRSEWTAEKFAGSLDRELEELQPALTAELHRLGERLLPVYAAESRKQFDRMGPQIARKLTKQLDHVGRAVQADATTRLLATEDHVRQQIERIVLECYPAVGGEAARAKLTSSFHQITDAAVASAIVDFDEQFSKDTDKLRDCLLKFEIEDTGEPTVDLQKRFISLWLRQLDQEIQKL